MRMKSKYKLYSVGNVLELEYDSHIFVIKVKYINITLTYFLFLNSRFFSFRFVFIDEFNSAL